MVEKRFNKLGVPNIEPFENYLPTAFNSELTLLQKVNKIIQDLIETNKLTNEMIDYLNNFVKTFDEKMYDTVLDILLLWKEDGFLGDLLNDTILAFKRDVNKPTYNQLNTRRVFRKLYNRTGQHNLQGACYTGNGKMLYALSGVGDVLLQEVDANGDLIRSKVMMLQHGNWLSFNPNLKEVYVSGLYEVVNGVQVQSHNVYVLNYSDLTLKETLTISGLSGNEGISSFHYDIITQRYWLKSEAKGSNATTLYEYDNETRNITSVPLKIDPVITSVGNQGICVHDGMFYIVSHESNSITLLNRFYEAVSYFNVNNRSDDRYFIGELECLTPIYDDDQHNFILGSYKQTSHRASTSSAQFFKCNFERNIVENGGYVSYEENRIVRYVKVDNSSPNNNPNGSEARPFNTIGEALEVAYGDIYNNVIVNVVGTGTPYDFVSVYKQGSYTIQSYDETKPLINGMRFDGGNIILRNLNIQNNKTDIQRHDCVFRRCTVSLINIGLLSSGSEYNSNIHNNNSIVKINNAVQSNHEFFGETSENGYHIGNVYQTKYYRGTTQHAIHNFNNWMLLDDDIRLGANASYQLSNAKMETLKLCHEIMFTLHVAGQAVVIPFVRGSLITTQQEFILTSNVMPNSISSMTTTITTEVNVRLTTDGVLSVFASTAKTETYVDSIMTENRLTLNPTNFEIIQIFCR